jgi:2-polyprenyl-3-methyl-5-hydroxy-6-metoxy-1,4-benzoquinol methylase
MENSQKVLFERFKYNNTPLVYLNQKRKKIKKIIEIKLNTKEYKNELINCHVCGSQIQDHQLISSKERHGLAMDTVACKNCGLVFTNPRMSKESFADFYTKYYRELYNYKFGKNDLKALFKNNYENGKKVYSFVHPFIKENIKVLEIGCANGGLLRFFSEMGHEVTGLDLGEQEIEFGKKYYNLNLIHKSIDDYYSQEKQDLIIMIHVIEHLTDCQTTMNKIFENLNDSGLLYISAPDIDTLKNGEIYKGDWLKLMQNAHTIHFDKKSMQNLLQKYGFELHHFEPGMSLLARKMKVSNLNVQNNFDNIIKTISETEIIYQDRRIQNQIRTILETKGIFAVLEFLSKPLNKILVSIGMQKYFKGVLKRIYRLI